MTMMDFSISDIIQVVILLALSAQAFFIYKTLKADHERRKKQATFEYVNAVSERFRNAIDAFNSRHGDDRMVDIADYSDEDKRTVRAYLNEMERICTGINSGVFDYDILKRMMAGNLMRNHNRFSQYIAQAQINRPRLFCEFDSVVARLRQDENPVVRRPGDIQHS